jgi:hypothetical protein
MDVRQRIRFEVDRLRTEYPEFNLGRLNAEDSVQTHLRVLEDARVQYNAFVEREETKRRNRDYYRILISISAMGALDHLIDEDLARSVYIFEMKHYNAELYLMGCTRSKPLPSPNSSLETLRSFCIDVHAFIVELNTFERRLSINDFWLVSMRRVFPSLFGLEDRRPVCVLTVTERLRLHDFLTRALRELQLYTLTNSISRPGSDLERTS